MFLGLTAESWGIIGAFATALATVFAAAGLIMAGIGMRQNAFATQLQVLEGIFRDIRELDQRYLANFGDMSGIERTAWSSTFFNTVEYLCFVVNNKLARRDALQSFFAESLPSWKRTFDEHVSQGILTDKPHLFSEFKRACVEWSTVSLWNKFKKWVQMRSLLLESAHNNR